MTITLELGQLPEPREMDGSRWGYDADDMRNYAMDAYAAGMAAERERCAMKAAPERIPFSDDEWRVRCDVRDSILDA